VPLCRQAAPDGPEPELPGPQHHQPLPGCPFRYRLVNAQASAARQQAAPAAVAVAVTAVSYGGHSSFLPRLNAPAELVGQCGDNACGAADTAEPAAFRVLSEVASESGAVGVRRGQDVLNVVYGEHDAVYAQRVRRCVFRLGADHRRRMELRQLKPAVAVRVRIMAMSAARSSTTTPTWSIRRIAMFSSVEDRTAPSFRAQLSRSGAGSSGHKITARSAASWMTELSSSARASATSYSSQDTTKVTGPAGGSG
jgi:hypothetical protein